MVKRSTTKKVKGGVKAPPSPPKDKMIRAAPTRKCPGCGMATFSTKCPNCGHITKGGTTALNSEKSME